MKITFGGDKPKGGSRLNMAIARTHTFSSRILGMQLTGGTLVGVMLSALQMSVGFLIIGSGVI